MNNLFGMFFDSRIVPIDDFQDVKVTIPENHFNSLNQIIINNSNINDIKNKNDICNICMDEYMINDKLTSLPCKHAFHTDCIKNWLCNEKVTCPTCRKDVRN